MHAWSTAGAWLAVLVAPPLLADELTPPCVARSMSATPVEVAVDGVAPVEMPVTGGPAPLAIAVLEQGIDVLVFALASDRRVLAVVDSPVARDGVQLVSPAIGGERVAALRIEARDAAARRGRVIVSPVVAQPGTTGATHCAGLTEALARGDQAYGARRMIALQRRTAEPGEATRLLRESRGHYAAARRRVAPLRDQNAASVEFLLASLSYHGEELWQAAADWALAAQLNHQRLGNRYAAARARALRAAALLEIATVARSASTAPGVPQESSRRFEDARAAFEELAVFFQQRGERYQAALQTNNLGLAYFYEAQFARALPYFRRARDEFASLSEQQRAGLAAQNMAMCDWGLGRLSSAIASLEQAVPKIAMASEPYLHLIALNNLGYAQYAAGRFDAAQQTLLDAHGKAVRANYDGLRARALYGMAITQYALGDRTQVEPLLRQVLAVWTPQADARGHVTALRSLAALKRDARQYAEAMLHSRAALELAASPTARGRIILDVAETEWRLGRDRDALARLAPLVADAVGHDDPLLQASALLLRGSVRRAAGEQVAALADLETALPTLRRLQDVAAEFRCLVELARAHLARGAWQLADRHLDAALDLSDEIRGQTANPEYRAALSGTLRDAVGLKLEIRWRRYESSRSRAEALAAFAIADAPRGMVLEELRARSSKAAASRAILRELAEMRHQLATRYDREGHDDAVVRELRAGIAERRVRLALEQRVAGAASASLARRVAATGQRLDALGRAFPQRAFVEYWLGDEVAYAWVLRGGNARWVRLGSADAIRVAVARYQRAMTSSHTVAVQERLAALHDLHGLIWRPVESYALPATETIIVADGALSSVSFAALYDPADTAQPFLAQRTLLSLAPSLGVVAPRFERGTAYARGLLLVADGVYSPRDPRLGAAARTAAQTAQASNRQLLDPVAARPWQRLVWSGIEARDIAAVAGGDRAHRRLGFAASREQFLRESLGDYRWVHLAVHALADPEVPQLSAVLFSRFDAAGRSIESDLRTAELAALDWRAEAVVLSACDTAVGRRVGDEGVLGLQYAVLAGGARNVIASYWEVQDEITSRLMTETYKEMLSNNRSPSVALGLSMRKLLQTAPDLDPASWAVFATHSILPSTAANERG